jgi:hypothetical protein
VHRPVFIVTFGAIRGLPAGKALERPQKNARLFLFLKADKLRDIRWEAGWSGRVLFFGCTAFWLYGGWKRRGVAAAAFRAANPTQFHILFPLSPKSPHGQS